jgi:hypothetical protein
LSFGLKKVLIPGPSESDILGTLPSGVVLCLCPFHGLTYPTDRRFFLKFLKDDAKSPAKDAAFPERISFLID